MLYIGPKQMSTFGLWSCFSFALLFQSLCCLRCPPKAVTAPLDERRVPSIVTLYLWRRHQSHLFWSQLRWKAKEEKTDAFSKNMRLFLFFFLLLILAIPVLHHELFAPAARDQKRDLLGAFDPAHSVQSKRARVRLPHTTLLFQVLTFVLPSVCCYC